MVVILLDEFPEVKNISINVEFEFIELSFTLEGKSGVFEPDCIRNHEVPSLGFAQSGWINCFENKHCMS
ncbi:MAG: hypothetical protein QXL94_06300, partial [Candidatus Parvarchaeum sp.]